MASHDHAHAPHDHAGHQHGHGALDNERRVLWAMVLTGGFMLVEAIGGVLAGSLALLADAPSQLSRSGSDDGAQPARGIGAN